MGKNKNSFEDNLKRLEEIVRQMERGDVPLDKSLELFQEGTALLQTCSRLLDNAELQIKKILVNADGEPIEEDFISE